MGRVWWWTAPTYGQALHGFRGLVEIARSADLVARVTATPPMELELTHGTIFQARSWERPENLRGPTVLGGVSDEFGLLTDPAYGAISSRRAETIAQGFGHWRWIGNVGEMGSAAESLWEKADAGSPGFACRTWTWRDRAAAHPCPCELAPDLETADLHGEHCPRGLYVRFIARERDRMSAPQFRQMYEAEWVDWNLLPVYEFERAVHVNDTLAEYQAGLPVDICCDFNVDPMCWVLGQTRGTRAWDYDEIVIPGGATTRQACTEVIRRHPDPKTPVRVFGDASGKARDTRSKVSDYQIIEEILGAHYYSFEMHVPSSNPPVVERLNAVNALLAPGGGEVRYHVHSRCKQLVNDRARVSFKPGTREIEKKNKSLTHGSDASDYRLVREFPSRPLFVPTIVTGTGQGLVSTAEY